MALFQGQNVPSSGNQCNYTTAAAPQMTTSIPSSLNRESVAPPAGLNRESMAPPAGLNFGVPLFSNHVATNMASAVREDPGDVRTPTTHPVIITRHPHVQTDMRHVAMDTSNAADVKNVKSALANQNVPCQVTEAFYVRDRSDNKTTDGKTEFVVKTENSGISSACCGGSQNQSAFIGSSNNVQPNLTEQQVIPQHQQADKNGGKTRLPYGSEVTFPQERQSNTLSAQYANAVTREGLRAQFGGLQPQVSPYDPLACTLALKGLAQSNQMSVAQAYMTQVSGQSPNVTAAHMPTRTLPETTMASQMISDMASVVMATHAAAAANNSTSTSTDPQAVAKRLGMGEMVGVAAQGGVFPGKEPLKPEDKATLGSGQPPEIPLPSLPSQASKMGAGDLPCPVPVTHVSPTMCRAAEKTSKAQTLEDVHRNMFDYMNHLVQGADSDIIRGGVDAHGRPVCGKCGRGFESPEDMMKHVKEHLDGTWVTENVITQGAQSANTNTDQAKTTNTTEGTGDQGSSPAGSSTNGGSPGKHKCTTCGKSFKRNDHLQRHMKLHSGAKPYQCDQCHKGFNRLERLQTHHLTHSGLKSYPCLRCGKIFSRNDHLQSHLTVHTGDKHHPCQHCGKNFSRLDHLRRHMRIHSGEKPYKCDHCTKEFSRDDHYLRHLRTHTGEKPYSCDVCPKKFTRSHHLKTHMLSHTGESKHVCTICGKGFRTTDRFNKHKQKHANATSCDEFCDGHAVKDDKPMVAPPVQPMQVPPVQPVQAPPQSASNAATV